MKTSISLQKIELPSVFATLSTRKSGAEARNHLLHLLEAGKTLEIDFLRANISPSFADECFGVLAQTIGMSAFKRQLQLKNATDASRSLIRHVISKRISATVKVA